MDSLSNHCYVRIGKGRQFSAGFVIGGTILWGQAVDKIVCSPLCFQNARSQTPAAVVDPRAGK